jgi:hypothetical protein
MAHGSSNAAAMVHLFFAAFEVVIPAVRFIRHPSLRLADQHGLPVYRGTRQGIGGGWASIKNRSLGACVDPEPLNIR